MQLKVKIYINNLYVLKQKIMKIKYAGIHVISLMLLAFAALTSCNEEWDEHYNAAPANKSDLNIFEFIKSKPDLSKFTQMLEATEYDSILSQSQTFTVWAPTNAALQNVDLNNYDQVLKIVTNHITRFSHPTSEVFKKTGKITLMNHKILEFEKTQSGYVFGNKIITEPDLATSNGIVHIIGEYSPYMRNFWEFINEQQDLDSLRNYLNSLTRKTFDEIKSFEDGVFVDSVFKETNYVLDRLAQLKNEDSIYTAILPNNAAWIESYNKIMPYFVTLPKDGGTAVQIAVTKQMLVRDLFFSGKFQSPVNKDTIMSTYGNKFANPDRFFENTTLTALSNGNAFVSPQLKNEPSETWLKEFKWQAEYSNFRTSANYTLSALTSIGSGFDVSNGYYLYTIPTTTSDLASINNMFVKFALPSTLSATYNIYCVIVPTIIVDANDLKPNKLRFFLSYVNSAGVQVNDMAINANNEVTTSNVITAANIFTTDPTQINKMLVVKNFKFPYSNVVSDSKTGLYTPTAFLRVNNAARATEINFKRSIRIDCIILEPVQ